MGLLIKNNSGGGTNLYNGSTGNAGKDVDLSALTSGTALPIGSIVAFHGTGAIPAGWFICDGANNTVDLRDMFVHGCDVDTNLKKKAGSSDTVLASHTHTVAVSKAGGHKHTTPGGTVHTSGAGNHTHLTESSYQVWNIARGRGPRVSNGNLPTQYTDNGGNHAHGCHFSVTVHGHPAHKHTASVASSGSGTGVGKNIPPYVTLAYIERIS